MQWDQVLAIVGANIVLILGMLGVVIGIWLHQDKKLDNYRKNADDDRREIVALIREIKHDSDEFKKTWAEESKEFHGRLCTIEQARK